MPVCVWCNRDISQTVTLTQILSWGPFPVQEVCEACQERLTRITGSCCPQCGRQQRAATICHDCERWHDGAVNRALFQYDAGFKAYMQQYKFQGDYALRVVVQAALAQALQRTTYDVLVPVPVDAATWQDRGFNQVTGWLTGQPFFQALEVVADHKERPQSAKTRAERLVTPQPFSLAPNACKLLHQRRVLLLDDVYTTGRTIRHAIDQINLSGAKAVTSLTLAR